MLSTARTGDIRWLSWSRHCATSRKVAGLFSDGVIRIFHRLSLSATLWPWDRLSLLQKWVPKVYFGE